MNTEERLLFYKKMLRDYKLSQYFPKLFFKTVAGFCYYIRIKTKYSLSLPDFPELLTQGPTYFPIASHWYSPGLLKPRIKCIKMAIELCEKEIKTSKVYNILTDTDFILCKIRTPQFHGSQYIFHYHEQIGVFFKNQLKFFPTSYTHGNHDVHFNTFEDFCFSVVEIYK